MKKEMLINVLQPEECRIAIVEDGVLEELYVERTSLESYTGNIYKGRIVNLEPAIQAAFVDFSVGRNGFLHVSDVEPQYYNRHSAADAETTAPRDRDRDRGRGRDRDPKRDDRRRADRPEIREIDDPPQSRDRDRPDRSERGRRDRSEPRRFGEGLLGEDLSHKPPPLPADLKREEPPRPEREEPRRPHRPEPQSAPSPREEGLGFGRGIEHEREREREVRPPTDMPPPRAWGLTEPEPFDPDLPPSRTQRQRPVNQPSRLPEFSDENPGRTRLEPVEPELETPSTIDRERERDPRKGRNRGRGNRRPPEPVIRPEAEPIDFKAPDPDDLEEAQAAAIEDLDDRDEPPRRRGRAAIRSRGGERDTEPERPRPRERERERESERPRDDRDRLAAELETERSRSLDRERPRTPEAEPPRERSRHHDRAGEPGYVPRRERVRGVEPFGPPFEPDVDPNIEPPSALEWASELETELEDETTGEDVETETTTPTKTDGPRRRRRRRRGRRDRDRVDSPASSTNPEELDLDSDEEIDDEAGGEPLPASARRGQPPAPRASISGQDRPVGTPSEVDDDLGQDFDFDEDAGPGRYDDEDDEDDFGSIDDESTVAVIAEDDGIAPGLEEEIRREAEEIAELEREMGLRGTTEARPRRGDERESIEGAAKSGPGRFTRGRGLSKPMIQDVFRRGDEVLVQVIKESIGTKGPTLSTYISIPGRYLVLMPGLNRVGVSRKIADESQRRKLRDIMNELNPPKGLGFIVRTAGLERTKRELARDLAYLLRLWKVILRRIKKARGPSVIYQESDMITRTIRDIFTSEIDTIWIDEPQAFERAQEFLRVVMPKFVNRLKLYDERVPLFHKYGLEDEIAKIQRRHVPLPEGGSIVIDQTEALVAIDVNSGNFRVENDAERTAYEMNLRAAKEIARQLRLRDLGGVIVNDFIDMRDERHRRGVERALRDAIKRDRARTKLLRMSAFGLIEMTRQRIRPSLKRSVYEDCAHCAGAGVVKTVESMSIDVMRLLALASHREEVRRVNVSVSPAVALYLCNRKRLEITALESSNNLTIYIGAEAGAPAEHLQIECFDAHNNEVRLQALPSPHRRSAWHKD